MVENQGFEIKDFELSMKNNEDPYPEQQVTLPRFEPCSSEFCH
jgi:hypothetical protein